MVHEVVGRINGQYGTLTHVPIYHLDRRAYLLAPPPPAAARAPCGPLRIHVTTACRLLSTVMPCLPSTLGHAPCRQLSFNELVALYAITDVALVTSLRDGMNLGGCWAVGGG